MKKLVLGIPIIIAGLFALGTAAQAETGAIVANINHDFVAGGTAHSAGTYLVYRLTPDTLVLRNEESGASVFMLSSMHKAANQGQQLEVKLTRSGDVYYLNEVVTDLGIYTLPEPRALTRAAKVKDQTTMGQSGSN